MVDPITVSMETFKAMSGLNDRKARKLVADRDVDSVKIGKRRFIVLASYHAYLERLRAEQTATTSHE